MIFEYDYKPVIEDFSKDGTLTMTAIVKIMENAANIHSDKVGDSVFNIRDLSRAWILTDWQIQIDEYPVYGDEVKTETWSECVTSPLVANRNFIFYKNGTACGIASTRWILLDLTTGRPSRIDSSSLEKYEPEDKTVFEDKKLTKIPVPETFEKEIKIPVRKSDIDFNNHVHNLTYLDFAKEVLPDDDYNKNFRTLRISYKTALKEGSTAICRYAKVENQSVVFIFDGCGNQCCNVMFGE